MPCRDNQERGSGLLGRLIGLAGVLVLAGAGGLVSSPYPSAQAEEKPPADGNKKSEGKVPRAVRNFQVHPGNGMVSLHWSGASDPSVRYEYRQRVVGNGGRWGEWQKIVGGSGAVGRTHEVRGLRNGVKYIFRVRAVNEAGSGAPSAAKGATPQGVVTLSIGDGRLVEGDRGRQAMDFVVKLSDEPVDDVKVRVRTNVGARNTAIGDAGAPQDFVPLSQSIVFAAHSRARRSQVNELQQTVRVQVLGDERAEGDETFDVWLENLETTDSRVVLVGGREKVNAVGVISDDDAAPVLAPIADGTAQVGEAVSIVAAATDADGDPITYSWSRGSQTPALPAGTVLNQARLSFSPSTAGIYTLNVTASDNHGNSATEDVVITVSAPLSTPSAPTGFSAQAGDGQVVLLWTGANDESITGYEVRQKKGGRGWGDWTPFSTAGGPATKTHTVSGLVNGKSYSYKIRAVNAAGAGAASQTVKVTPVAPLATPAAPTGFMAFGSDGYVVLVWDQATDDSITGYEFRQKRQGEGAWGEWTPISNFESHVVYGLINGERYSYQLRAVNAAGAGSPSQTEKATPLSPPPGAPRGLSAQAGNAQVTLSWDVANNDSITGYEVRQESRSERSCSRGSIITICVGGDGQRAWGEWTPINDADAETASHTITGLVNGQRYRYQIRAVNLRGKGRVSTIVEATPTAPLPAAPTGLSAQPGSAQVTLSWDAATDESITGYEVRQQGRTGSQQSRVWGSWTPIPKAGAETTSHTVTDLINGESYSYMIRAVNTAGAGVPSTTVDATPTGAPTISVSNAQVAEGNTGQKDMVFTVVMNGSPSAEVKLTATVLAGPSSTATATEGNTRDFIPLNKKIKFAANAQGAQLQQTIRVKVLGDDSVEPDENFLLRLDNLETEDQRVAFASGGEKMYATGTITNDDAKGVSLSCRGEHFTQRTNKDRWAALIKGKKVVGFDERSRRTGTVTGYESIPESFRSFSIGGLNGYEYYANVRITASEPADRDITFRVTYADGAVDNHYRSVANKWVDYDPTPLTVTLPAGQTEVSFPSPILDDDMVETGNNFTMCLEPTAPLPEGYVLYRSSVVMGISDNDGDHHPVGANYWSSVSVSDPTVQEGPGAQLAFNVKLNRNSYGPSGGRVTPSWVEVKYFTRDRTAAAGADYTATSGTLRFEPGETEKTINVAVLDDAHDEGSETMELVVYEALANVPGQGQSSHILIGTGWLNRDAEDKHGVKGVGTIVNEDPIPAAWLSRFGRTVADQVLDAISDRVAADRTPGLTGSLAGQPLSNETLGLGNNGVIDTAQADTTLSLADGDSLASYQSMTAQDLLLGSAFTLTRATGVEGAGGTLAFWGAAAHSGFDGKEDSLSLDGQVTTGLLGIDYARSRWLLGLGISHSAGKGNYSDSNTGSGSSSKGEIETSLTAALPYGAWQVSDRVKLWGAVGYGMGQMRLEPDSQKEIKADINWSMAAVGARAALLDPDGEGLSLDLISDALWSRITSEEVTNPNLSSTESDVTRLRVGLEGSWQISLDNGGEVLPKLSLGARYDGGDAETGLGVELGGGMVWSAPERGITLDVGGRTLLLHAAEGLKDWGVSASLIFDPNPETERGLSVSLGQEWGGQATDGLDALFAANPLEQRSGVEGTSHWSLEAAYGFPVFSGHFTGSPYVGLGIGSGLRDYSIGWRLTPEITAQRDISLDLKATRSEDAGARPEHRLGFELQRAW